MDAQSLRAWVVRLSLSHVPQVSHAHSLDRLPEEVVLFTGQQYFGLRLHSGCGGARGDPSKPSATLRLCSALRLGSPQHGHVSAACGRCWLMERAPGGQNYQCSPFKVRCPRSSQVMLGVGGEAISPTLASSTHAFLSKLLCSLRGVQTPRRSPLTAGLSWG